MKPLKIYKLHFYTFFFFLKKEYCRLSGMMLELTLKQCEGNVKK